MEKHRQTTEKPVEILVLLALTGLLFFNIVYVNII